MFCRQPDRSPLAPARILHARPGRAIRRASQQRDPIMKLSARNQLKGNVTEIVKGATTAHVRLDVGGSIVTASITNEAVDELGLKVGQTAYAVIKASDVMVAVDD